MSIYRLTRAARDSVDEINDYSAARWGEEQAEAYTNELFLAIEQIADRGIVWRPLPRHLGIEGFSRTWQSHIIYWREEGDDSITIVAVLHEAMDLASRVPAAFLDVSS